MKVLIADDDLTSLRVLEMVLGKWGYGVTAVHDGTEALKAAIALDAPRLLILDWMMPGRSGVEVAADLRRRKEDESRYIIMLTSRDAKDDTVVGLESGADDYLVKPFHHNELRARIRVGERVLELQASLAGRVRELQDALEHVRSLQGMLPICMHCRKVRDDREVWQRIEEYIEDHSAAKFSHCLCPSCFQEFYPEFARSKVKKA